MHIVLVAYLFDPESENSSPTILHVVPRVQLQDHFQTASINLSLVDKMMNSSSNSIVTIISNGVRYEVEKSILAENSPVFQAMLEISMLEHSTNEIVMDDFDSETVGTLLITLSSQSPFPLELKDHGIPLLTIAEKFQCMQVKSLCEQHLIAALNNDNVLHYIQVAEFLHCNDLMAASIQYAVRHSETVVNFSNVCSVLSVVTSQLLMNALRDELTFSKAARRTEKEGAHKSLSELLSLTHSQYSDAEKRAVYPAIQDSLRSVILNLQHSDENM